MKNQADFFDTPIQKQFEKIADILRDDAHEGIGEAVADLRTMVFKLQISHANLQEMMNATLTALKSDNEQE